MHQRGDLVRAQLTQTAERLDALEPVDANHPEGRAGQIGTSEPVQDLQQLQLIQQVVLEPKNDGIMGRSRAQVGIARTETLQDRRRVGPAGQVSRPYGA